MPTSHEQMILQNQIAIMAALISIGRGPLQLPASERTALKFQIDETTNLLLSK